MCRRRKGQEKRRHEMTASSRIDEVGHGRAISLSMVGHLQHGFSQPFALHLDPGHLSIDLREILDRESE